jgi:hypothetical protein
MNSFLPLRAVGIFLALLLIGVVAGQAQVGSVLPRTFPALSL